MRSQPQKPHFPCLSLGVGKEHFGKTNIYCRRQTQIVSKSSKESLIRLIRKIPLPVLKLPAP